MWSDTLVSCLVAFFVMECSGAVTFNLYTPYNYNSIMPTYWYAITPANQPHVQLQEINAYYHATSPLAMTPPTPALQTIPIQQLLTNLRTFVAYQRPSDDDKDESTPIVFNPSCNLWSWPENVCDDDSDYPQDVIQDILKDNFILPSDWPIEPLTDSSIGPRGIDSFSGVDRHSSCDAESRIIYPRVARSIKNKWVYVANYDDYSQPVRVKKCSSYSDSCSQRTLSTYGSKCRQKTERLTMVAIDVKQRKPYKETFDMPVECECAVLSSVFPTRSNRPGSQPPPQSQRESEISSRSHNEIRPANFDSFEPRTRRRH